MAPKQRPTTVLRLFDHVLSPEAYTVRLMLGLLGLKYERIAVDAYPGGGEVPVLEDGDTALRDPGLILTWLARSHGPQWLPADGTPQVVRWLAFAAVDLGALNRARGVTVFGQGGDVDALRERGRLALRMLDDHLALAGLEGTQFVAGDQPTIADIAVFAPTMLSHDCGVGHEEFPAINLWQRRVRRLPGFVGMPGIPDYF